MFCFAVCDDEIKSADGISERICGYFNEKNIRTDITKFCGGTSLLDSQKNFDAVFLDVKMPAPDGIETAHFLRRSGYDGFIVFITILEDYVYDSFEVSPFDYIVKPVDTERFSRTLSRLSSALERKKRTLVIRSDNEKRVLSANEIVYCEVIDRRIYIHMQSGETVSFYGKMEDVEGLLYNNFFKCHRSYIINLDCAVSFSGATVCMSDGSLIPVSRLRKKEFEQALIRQMRG